MYFKKKKTVAILDVYYTEYEMHAAWQELHISDVWCMDGFVYI
jgi:hypothetical protein